MELQETAYHIIHDGGVYLSHTCCAALQIDYSSTAAHPPYTPSIWSFTTSAGDTSLFKNPQR